LAGASDHCHKARRERRQKICCQADVVKYAIISRKWYYFMKCNKESLDPIGYKTCQEMRPEEVEKAFHILCTTSGQIFLSESKDAGEK